MSRILVFSTQLLNTGGIESHIFQFCKEISKQNHSIDLLVLKSTTDVAKKNLFSTFCQSVLFVNDNYIFYVKSILIAFRILFKKYDILYTNGQGNSLLFLTRIIRFKRHIHHHHTSGDALDRKTWPPLYIKVMKTADILIACSQTNATNMSYFLDRSVFTIPVFSRQIDFCKSITDTSTHKIHLGYYGRLIPEKGINFLSRLSMDNDCRDIVFHVWGEGNHYNAAFFKHPQSNIQFHGSFSTAHELQSVYNILDGYLLLSTHSEGLPVSILEVMSVGIPWLATNKGGIPDLFIDYYNTSIIDYRSDYDDIKNAVLVFADNIRLKRIDPALIIKHYQQKFSTESIIHQWNKMLS